jgi:hypothetical protein
MRGRNASPTLSFAAKLFVVNVNPAGSVANACDSASASSDDGLVVSMHDSASAAIVAAAILCATLFMFPLLSPVW